MFSIIEKIVVILTAISLLVGLIMTFVKQRQEIESLLEMQQESLKEVRDSVRALRRDAYFSSEKLQDDINNIEGFLATERKDPGVYARRNSDVKAQNFLKPL